jgi:hypothetical protein
VKLGRAGAVASLAITAATVIVALAMLVQLMVSLARAKASAVPGLLSINVSGDKMTIHLDVDFGATVLLWLALAGLIAVGVIVLGRVVRGSRSGP